MMTEYGFPLFIWYCVLWVASFGTLLSLLHFKIITWEDIIWVFEQVGVAELLPLEKIDPQLGSLAVAILVNECIEPLRLPVAVVTLKPLLTLAGRLFSRKP